MGFAWLRTRYGAADRVSDAEDVETDQIRRVKFRVKWKWWGSTALGIDEQGMVRAIRINCKGLLVSKKE